MATKRTYQPKKLHGQKVHGLRKRMATANGRKVRPGPSPRQGPCPSVLLSETDARETLEQTSSGTAGIFGIPPSLKEFLFKMARRGNV